MVLGGILAAAMALRLAYVVGAQWDDPVVGDAIYYSAQAEAIAEGRWFEHPFTGEAAADHPPVTALLFAPATWAPGDLVQAQRVLGALVGVAVVAAIAALALELAGATTALVAAALAAVYPGLWINDGLIMSETPTALVTALLLRSIVRWHRGTTASWVVGAWAGLAVLTRAELAILVALGAVGPVLLGRSRPSLRQVAVVGAVGLAVMVPWTVRNLVRFERPVLVSTNDGLTLVGANCDSTYGQAIGFWDLRCAPAAHGDQSEVSATYRSIALSYIRDHLDDVPRVTAARVGRVWSLWRPNDQVWFNTGEDREPWASRLALWSFWCLCPIAAAGLIALRRRQEDAWWPLAATAVTVTITAAAFYGIVRFRLPAEVAMVACAALPCRALLARVSRRPTLAAAG